MQVEQGIPTSAQVRVYLLGALEIWKKDPSGAWKVIPTSQWKSNRPARSVFKRLLVQPGRRLARGTIEDDIWSQAENLEALAKQVYNAISLIRGIIGKSLVTCWEATYTLADQALIWTDLDACSALLKEAENQGPGSMQAVALLEQVVALLDRGALLEGEEGQWCYAFRKWAEDMSRQARVSLAASYEAQGKHWQAGEQYRTLILSDPSDEAALQGWLEMLARHGKRQEVLRCYQEMKDFMQAQGFPLSKELEQVIASLRKQFSLSLISPIQLSEEIPLLHQRVGGESMNYSRRQMLQGILATACTTLTLAPYNFLPLEKSERLLASVRSPWYMNEDVLDDFSEIIKNYWKLSANISLQLLNGLFGLFQDITQILAAPQRPPVAERLYSLSSEVAQLLGKSLFDLRDYSLASSYYGFALKAALQAHNYDLWAASLGRIGLLLLSSNQPEQALLLLQEAHSIPIQSTKIRLWHAAIEAEAYSYLENFSACQKSLERAKDTSEAIFLEADSYATGFTRARLASYEGSSYLRLNLPEHALPVLEQALTLIDPAAIRRLSRLLTYLGETHLSLGHERQAYEYASQALDLTGQTQSLDILRHVRELRDGLLMRGESFYTKELDRRIEETQAMIASVGRFHE